jgi:hypothetical protein
MCLFTSSLSCLCTYLFYSCTLQQTVLPWMCLFTSILCCFCMYLLYSCRQWPICHRCRWYLDLQISPQIFEKFEMSPMPFQGLGGRWLMEKTWSKKSCNTVPLSKTEAENEMKKKLQRSKRETKRWNGLGFFFLRARKGSKKDHI